MTTSIIEITTKGERLQMIKNIATKQKQEKGEFQKGLFNNPPCYFIPEFDNDDLIEMQKLLAM